MTAASEDHPEEAGSQAVKVQLRLREMILAGELTAGAHRKRGEPEQREREREPETEQ
jgi:hypothetical protein